MGEYFLLQVRLFNRWLSELGIPSWLGYVLISAGFPLLLGFLFTKSRYAGYLAAIFIIGILIRLSEKRRTEFLSVLFGDSKARTVRMIENYMISLPLAVVLIYYHDYIPAVILFILSPLLTISFKAIRTNFAIPTPFSNRPFEFTIGFRNTFLLIAGAYILTIIALSANNYNLGIFSLLFLFLVAMTYYLKPEQEFYIWIFSDTPFRFLVGKVKAATIYSVLLVLPVVFLLLIFFPEDARLTLFFLFMGMAFLWTVILAKYAAYPREINLPEFTFIAVCVYFPPLLLALLPYFYMKSVKKLSLLLK
jgi:hypothetical protein